MSEDFIGSGGGESCRVFVEVCLVCWRLESTPSPGSGDGGGEIGRARQTASRAYHLNCRHSAFSASASSFVLHRQHCVGGALARDGGEGNPSKHASKMGGDRRQKGHLVVQNI